MISIALWRRPGHDWPIVLAFTGTGMGAPGRYWEDRPELFGLMDGLLALNESGVIAAILPTGTQGKRPASELVLDALDFSDARDAVDALRDLDPAAYQPFTLLVADNRDAYVVRRWDGSKIEIDEIAPGLLTLGGLADPFSAEPEPGKAGWMKWREAVSPGGILIALPSIAQFGVKPIWDQATGGIWTDLSHIFS